MYLEDVETPARAPACTPCFKACSWLWCATGKEGQSEWISCQNRGGWGSAVRMWGLCIVYLLLQFTSLQTHALLPCSSPEAG